MATRLSAPEALAAFLSSLEAQRTPADTVSYYREKLTFLFGLFPASVAFSRWKPGHFEAIIRDHPAWKAKRSVEMAICAARRFIRWCAERGIACPDFARGLKAHGARAKETVPYTAEQVHALLQRAREEESPLEVPIALAALAGLSLHDLREIEWSEIDLPALLIRRRREKTGEGATLHVCAMLADVLRRHVAVAGPVCRGLPLHDSALCKGLKRLEGRAGLAPLSWHGLRHSYATALSAAGATLAEVGAALQHRPGSLTAVRYVHATNAGVRAAVEAVGRAVAGV